MINVFNRIIVDNRRKYIKNVNFARTGSVSCTDCGPIYDDDLYLCRVGNVVAILVPRAACPS